MNPLAYRASVCVSLKGYLPPLALQATGLQRFFFMDPAAHPTLTGSVDQP